MVNVLVPSGSPAWAGIDPAIDVAPAPSLRLPRVGGDRPGAIPARGRGSSPRGRGRDRPPPRGRGSPAWAARSRAGHPRGLPRVGGDRPPKRRRRDHRRGRLPRVGGDGPEIGREVLLPGHKAPPRGRGSTPPVRATASRGPSGLSPRGRGSTPAAVARVARLIPAWAGIGPDGRIRRTCGGGSSPRGRGSDPGARANGDPSCGAHPRVGGDRPRVAGRPRRRGAGLIPAWAGIGPSDPRDRRRGEGRAGSSPRGRGSDLASARARSPRSCGALPAWAGIDPPIRARRCTGVPAWAGMGLIPAWAGIDPTLAAVIPAWAGIAPRRGRAAAPRLIPAWAGIDPVEAATPARGPTRAHPRVGGDRPRSAACFGVGGPRRSSPRGRGSTPDDPAGVTDVGLIPAWAGIGPVRAANSPAVAGSSPRGRGSTPLADAVARAVAMSGLIPAWAGIDPRARCRRRVAARAHPRVGGDGPRGIRGLLAPGSSPRGRGAQVGEVGGAGTLGLIPAWAGIDPPSPPGARPDAGSSPRGRGSDPARSRDPRRGRGSSPRGRGSDRLSASARGRAPGSSPRGRGIAPRVRVGGADGLIPAWAGIDPRAALVGRRRTGAHPRVGGDRGRAHRSRRRPGSPRGGAHPRVGGARTAPRVGGDRAGGRGPHARERLIPAWAGIDPPRPRALDGRRRAPRVGGAHPRVGGADRPAAPRCIPGVGRPRAHPRVGGDRPRPDPRVGRSAPGSSPRGRGGQESPRRAPGQRGLIPAWAGRTTCRPAPGPNGWAHPRVGGETRRPSGYAGFTGSSPRGRGRTLSDRGAHPRVGGGGSSPRGRGSTRRAPHPRVARLIPAWAGTDRGCRPAQRGLARAHPRVGGDRPHGAMQAAA